ncbi:hypothetical protein [Rhizobium sp. CF142]|uniref:hypothetical protein n=1 Tax=Rhizobium sp. CF142 TaxID=1144314 RepID=UPI00026EEDFC|nr:hypothetical protein [Rhizobium sp. CF142]EJJ26643.1 hypothetical protein PMI11_05093 [Rhizobium sp. CF142]
MGQLPDQQTRKKKASNSATIFVSVSLASAVWLVAGIVVLGHVAQSPSSCNGTFSCLTLDGWGTYLSGVFAPLAFFWLVATVWIQSRELAQQREELALTRKEFEHNREVMKAQSDYVGAQTDIVVRDQADHELLMLLRLFRTWAMRALRKVELFSENRKDKSEFTREMPDDPVDFIVALTSRLSLPIFQVTMFEDNGEYLNLFKHLNSETMNELADHLDRIIAMKPRVSPSNAALIDHVKSTVSTQDIRQVAQKLPSMMDDLSNLFVPNEKAT